MQQREIFYKSGGGSTGVDNSAKMLKKQAAKAH